MGDSSITSLFSLGEVLQRVAQLGATGCIHVYRAHHAGNIYLQDGLITAAHFQQQLDRPAVIAMLEGSGFRLLWSAGEQAQFPNLQITVAEVLVPETVPAAEDAVPPPEIVPADLTGPAPDATTSGTIKFNRKKTKRLPTAPLPPVAAPASTPPVQGTFYLQGVTDYRIIMLEKDGVVMGRDNTADVVVEHPSISRRHCTVNFHPNGLHITDLNSANGTLINGAPVQGTGTVTHGDTLTLGDIAFRVNRQELSPYPSIAIRQSRNGIGT